MAQNASYNTYDRIIRDAMKNAKLLEEGEDPSSEQFADYSNRLNDMINVWQTDGLRLWMETDLPVTLTAGTPLYTLGPSGTVVMTKPLSVKQAYTLDSSGNKTPLDPVLSRDEWTRLTQMTQQGAISNYFVDKQRLTLNVNLWLVPDAVAATGTLHLILRQQIPNLAMITDQVQFPVEWFMALHWGLSAEICSGQPAAIIARCEKWAMYYKEKLDAWDVEDASTQFVPDQRMGHGYNRFF